MDIYEKYNLDKTDDVIVDKLPSNIEKSFYQINNDKSESGYDELYLNENGVLKHVATKPYSFSILLLFLKKYRVYPELLPKNLKHEYPFDNISSEYIYKAMQLMLKPMNNFEEFKERLLLATEELMPLRKRSDIRKRLGEKIVFVNKKEELGSAINIYGEIVPILQEDNQTYWEEGILFDKENKIFEWWVFPERTNDTPDRRNWRLVTKFYEEQYLYEYLLNNEIRAVAS